MNVPKIKHSQEKKEKVSLSLSPDVLRELRSRSPGVAASSMVEQGLRSYLERIDMAERLRNVEILSRAALIMLSEHLGDQDAERLRQSAVQKALHQLRKLENRKKGLSDNADQGTSDQETDKS
jgi:hypothetical protein